MRLGFLLLASLSASAGLAQGPDTITLYGQLYTLAESVEVGGDTGSASRRLRLSDQGSRLGVRGTENLGHGLSAWFQLETGFVIDSPGSFATRNSGVGLEGPWGTLLFGRWDSAFSHSQASSVDPFNDQGLPDITGAAVHQGNFARRERNIVQYWSPRVAGIRMRTNYAANEGRTADVNPYDYGVALNYSDAVTFFSLAFEKHRDQAVGAPIARSNEEGRGVSGHHSIGPVKLYGQYGSYRRTGAITQRSYLVGLEVVRAEHGLLGTYQNSRNGGDASASTQPSCDLVGAGYRYRFSRRTFLIVQYARVTNKVGALCNFGTNQLAITDGQDLRGIAAGMRTAF